VAGERRLESRVPARLTPAEGRRFGLTVGTAFLVLGALLAWRGRALAPVAVALGALLCAAALVAPSRLGPVQRAWLALGERLGKVTTPVFLGIIYFGVIAPAGVLLRAFGRNPVARRRRAGTVWVPRAAETRSRRDMERQF
jgi:hypothetical protein